MSKLIIYGLYDPRTSRIRYVGKSSDGLRRPRAHGRRLKYEPGHKSNWIRQLQKLGLNYGIVILETASDVAELKTMECFWIAQGRGLDWPLTNLTNGGEGASGAKRSAETKEKLAASKRGKPRSEETKAKVAEGVRQWWLDHPDYKRPPRTVEHRSKISAANKGKTLSLETRAKMSAVRIGKKHSEESKLKMRAAQTIAAAGRRLSVSYDWTGKKHSDETKSKISKSLLGNSRGRKNKTPG